MRTAESYHQRPTTPKAKYEMNLAEFPIAILSKHRPQDRKSLEYQDTIIGKDGRIVPRKWKVSPSPEYGFGSSEMIGTLFELFQVWKESGFTTQSIPFGSIYNLIKRLGLKDAAPNYNRIRRDLHALVGILVEAKNAFWDNQKKAYVDKTFHLFESMTSYHEGSDGQQPLPLASIKASEELWGSIQANAIINAGVSREWFHSLSPGEQRLSLYLSKMLHAQVVHKREVTKLGEQLPVLAKARKKVKQQLGILSQGLLAKGHPLLASFHYEERRRGEDDIIVFISKKIKAKTEDSESHEPSTQEGSGGFLIDRSKLTSQECKLLEEILEVCKDHKSEANYLKVIRTHPEALIEMVIAETREAARKGEIKKTNGAYFMDTLKHIATMRAHTEPTKGGGRRETRKAGKTCNLCNEDGMIFFKDGQGNQSAARCPHTIQTVEAYASQNGLTRVEV